MHQPWFSMYFLIVSGFASPIEHTKYPSSNTCHCCGWIKEGLQLKDREWTCPSCGEVLDRDINAAMNIHSEGLRNISAGTVDYTDGADIRPYQGQSAMKSEAHKSLVCG